MRIWTLHPKYLDAKGLVALWRETLLAQKVLNGETKGYKNHPQLARFKAQENSVAAVATYLHYICEEAARRGYNFNRGKIAPQSVPFQIISTQGQLLYEWEHLQEKLRQRDPKKYQELLAIKDPEAHPLFRLVEGEVEPWEMQKP